MIKKEHFLNSSKIDNKNIMVISDFHYSDTNSLGRLNSLYEMAAKEEISHIVIPGDLYNGSDYGIYQHNSRLMGFINNISQFAPVFYVQGNSEQDSLYVVGFLCDPEDFLRPTVHVLGNLHKEINKNFMAKEDGINVVGLGLDKSFYSLNDSYKPRAIAFYYRKWFSMLGKMISPTDFNVLLCHEPMVGEALALSGLNPDLFDLIITGHRHGANYPDELKTALTIYPDLISDAYPKYVSGFYHINGINAPMFVANGITEYTLDNKELEKEHEPVVDFIRVRKL